MYRFTMPDAELSIPEQKNELRRQCDLFMGSDALGSILELLSVDRVTLGEVYNARRTADGRILETQVMESGNALEPLRYELYPHMRELGFFDICRPLAPVHSRIAVLGGSLNACNVRTEYAAGFVNSLTVSVDGLTCYRPINPAERKRSSYASAAETEFGVISEAFSRRFGLGVYEDDFTGDRNLNNISCVRRFDTPGCSYGIYAAPSGEPDLRRADTGDTLDFYMDNSGISSGDSILFITSNRYCNRQFLQLAYRMIKSGRCVSFDIIGTTPESDIVTADSYDPMQYIQDLISIIYWIGRF